MPADHGISGSGTDRGRIAGDTLAVAGLPVPVRLKSNARARRITLRLDARDGAVVVVLPPRVGAEEGLAFALAQAAWVRGRLAARPPRVYFTDGAELPLGGIVHRLSHETGGRRGVWAEDGVLHVSGGREFFARRVGDWLRRRARADLMACVLPMAASVGRTVAGVSVRDPISRWGSCAASGRLAFSWRLVLAPSEVLTYVVAHEVAHLVEMNHSPAFWGVVSGLCPEAARWRTWLKRHGRELHRYG